MTFLFEGDPVSAPKQRPLGLWVGGAAALLVVAGIGWTMWAKPGPEAPGQAPAASAPVPTPTQAPAPEPAEPAELTESTRTAAPRSEPVEEVIESTRAATAAPTSPASPAAPSTSAAPAATPVSAAAVAVTPTPDFTPVTAARVPDAAPAAPPVPKAPIAAPRLAPPSRTDDAPWPPVQRPAESPGDNLARLRSTLAQCAAMGNELSRTTCLARTRQNFCGDAWGRIAECPAGN